MYFPYLQPLKTTKEQVDVFGGYNHQERIGKGEWFDMENLSTRRFPLASPRPVRQKVLESPTAQGGQLLGKTYLWMVQERDLVGIDPQSGKEIATFTDVFHRPPLLCSFSSYIVDMKNGRWFHILPDEEGSFQTGEFGYLQKGIGETFGVQLCDETGNPLAIDHLGATPPTECVGGMLWFDTTLSPGVLKRYYEGSASFLEEPSYLKIQMDADLSCVEKGDMVTVTLPSLKDGQGNTYGLVDAHLPKKVMVVGAGHGDGMFLVVQGRLKDAVSYSCHNGSLTLLAGSTAPTGLTLEGTVCSVENALPILDFVVEAGNRLWGCHYGPNRKGEMVNEIYASALGSFRVWEKYEGISDDSYTLSCGTDGPFTGAITYNGNPIFFKETCMHRVYGTFPFGVTPVMCNGVERGSSDSLAVVGNTLYYKSPAGICMYNGSQPVLLDLPFGNRCYHEGVAAGTQTHYYCSLRDEEGEYGFFVYDTVNRLLTKESAGVFTHMICFGERVYATLTDYHKNTLLCLTGGHTPFPDYETQVAWFAQSGMIGMRESGGRYVQGLELILTLPLHSRLQVLVQYDSNGDWVPLSTLTGGKTRHITLPLRVRRCDHLQLKLQGVGDFTLHALIKTMRKGGTGPCR